MGTPLGPKYIPYTYMDPLGLSPQEVPQDVVQKERAVKLHNEAMKGLGFRDLGFRV